jgi:hypothetical protein
MSGAGLIELLAARLGGRGARRAAPALREALAEVSARGANQSDPLVTVYRGGGDGQFWTPNAETAAGYGPVRRGMLDTNGFGSAEYTAEMANQSDDFGAFIQNQMARAESENLPGVTLDGIPDLPNWDIQRQYIVRDPSRLRDIAEHGPASEAAPSLRDALSKINASRTGPDAGGGQTGRRATQEPMHPAFEGMTREEFLGSPRITTNRNATDLKPKALTTVQDQPAQPFMGGRFQVRMSEDGAAVYDGDNVIASYNFGDTLTVDRAHRRQGIAQELVYQWRTRYPGPAVARERTRASQAIQEQVWERIKNDPGNGGNSGGGSGRGGPDGRPAQSESWTTLYRGSDTDGPFRERRWGTPDRMAARDYGANVTEFQGNVADAPQVRMHDDLRRLLGDRADELMATRRADVWEYLDDPAVQQALRQQGVSVVRVSDDLAPNPSGNWRNDRYHESYLILDESRIRTAPNAGSDRNALQRALRDRMNRE